MTAALQIPSHSCPSMIRFFINFLVDAFPKTGESLEEKLESARSSHPLNPRAVCATDLRLVDWDLVLGSPTTFKVHVVAASYAERKGVQDVPRTFKCYAALSSLSSPSRLRPASTVRLGPYFGCASIESSLHEPSDREARAALFLIRA